MLNATDRKYHAMGPKDVGIVPDKKAAMFLDVIRTTNNTGEQLHMQIPVYGDETREELNNRFNFAFSFIQDRLEAENQSIEWKNQRLTVIRRAQVVLEKNAKHFEKKLNELNKMRRKQNWSQEQFEHERKKLIEDLEKANAATEKAAAHAKAELEKMEDLPFAAEQEFDIQPLDGTEDNTATL